MLHVWRTPARHSEIPPSRRPTFPLSRFQAGDKLPRLGLSRVVRIYRLAPNPTSHRSSDSLPNPNPSPEPSPSDSSKFPSPPLSPTEEKSLQHTTHMDNLNDLPAELKPLAPFLQRAQELKVKDSTMSYWCTYYAVQQGVHLKPRDKQSRNYLMKLMAPLEAIRSDQSSTVVTNNDTACVYIEDFALRVFDAADNEDRRGDASRGTAKKFLAAANFLELLKVFEDDAPTEPSSSTTKTSSAFSQHKEKIRYAKWKAADIAKAFREGRKPSPGPAHAPASVTSPGLDGSGMNGTSTVGFPFDSHLSAVSLYQRVGSPTNNSSNTVSPQPGGSRNQSVSPAQKQSVLPFTSASDHRRESTGLSGLSNGSSYMGGSRTNGVQSPPREPTSPTTVNPPRPIGHARGRSVSQSQTQAPDLSGFSRPPQPPKDVLSLPPNRPTMGLQPLPGGTTPPVNPANLYATPAGKASGTWSTTATPGGFEARNGGTPAASNNYIDHQSSPSKVPVNMTSVAARQQNDTDASYPPHPYPAVKLSPPARPTLPGKEPFRPVGSASNATTNGGGAMSRPITYTPKATHQSAPTSPTEGYYTNKLAAMMDGKASEAANRALEAAENDDLGPLAEGRPSQKRVRWTASVAGGSTVGSESPGNSPKSPPANLPTLPESSDSNSSTGGEVKYTGDVKLGRPQNGTDGSPPTSIEDFQSSNKRSSAPPVPKKPQFPNQTPSAQPQPPPQAPYASYTPGPQTRSLPPSTSSPALNTSPRLAKNSPRTSPKGRPSDLPSHQTPTPGGTPNGSSFINHQSSAPPSSFTAFPPSSTASSASPAGTNSSLPTRPRRISASSIGPGPLVNGSQPLIKPFVPLFGAGPGGLPTPTSSAFSIGDRNSPRISPTPSSGTPTQVPSRALSPDNKALPTSLPFRQITAAKKHSKFATSALEFDDLETARAELLAALAILNGEKLD
ncbi:hypothetical protein FRB96_003537 [Tulasnella sp. 330]|nr:hypothetical protein FRB96_003537 [Tulasnella sp. 330]KAG8879900.1 hypothetical protein FRB97_001318 [Tulasnella sp. 331]